MCSANREEFQITDTIKCTGCSVCKNVCPKQCIEMKANQWGELYPSIDYDKCIGCHLCVKSCPSNEPVERHDILKSYVGWSNDNTIRKTSASGGIAASVYQYCTEHSTAFSGTAFTDEQHLQMMTGHSQQDIERFRGSKYCFCSMDGFFTENQRNLSDKLVFIGVPCQAAAARRYFKNHENILFIDLICHGVCPEKYLHDHLQKIVKGSSIDRLEFRDPAFGTDKFHFSVYRQGKLLYHKSVNDTDVYQLCYHRAYSYRPNCYECQYANAKRTGDITIGDYWGLGKIYPYNGETDNKSLILCNTQKGLDFLETLRKENYVTVTERPVDEALKTEKQLVRPSVKTPTAEQLRKEVVTSGNFETAARKVLKKTVLKYTIKSLPVVKQIVSLKKKLHVKK